MSGAAFANYARYYDLLYREKDYAAEARWIDGWLRAAGALGGSLLDIGCGTGAHAREFAQLGWAVSGVDLSPRMIEIARAKVPAGAAVDFTVGSATQFDLGRTFAAAVSLFHVASYQAEAGELTAMCANVRRHLRAGGAFVFDFWHAGGVRADPPAVRERRLEDERIVVRRRATPMHRPEEARIDVAYRVVIEEKGGATEVVEEVHRMRYFSRMEVEEALERGGFVAERWCGGLVDTPLGERDWYGLVVARAHT